MKKKNKVRDIMDDHLGHVESAHGKHEEELIDFAEKHGGQWTSSAVSMLDMATEVFNSGDTAGKVGFLHSLIGAGFSMGYKARKNEG